ncbi:hypothetical protein ASC80_03670 [Afipia sp. Root123D2]|uniref:NYN domain-containing protein n=1 Tax=Afipia sp. Root123D2 TaxID=1736436 RepID=UPI0006F37DF7|nr:NYN domain-containing protein [Afipia sp. Root123D2]KQW22494.1 hypothetical protein ASC80_03670 [Afipia sp. Root123D2]
MYIDGFNLYHSIDDLKIPHLKWLDLVKLGNLIIPKATEKLVRTVYCTAYHPGDSQKRWRHDQYLNALRVVGATPVFGHYIHEPKKCNSCGDKWQQPNEKETDINLALSIFNDARLDVFDTAYLVTADSDQAATAKMLRENFENKKLVTVAPPGRNFSTHILANASARIALNQEHLERCLFSAMVFKEGQPAGRRPREYEPPQGWTPPA